MLYVQNVPVHRTVTVTRTVSTTQCHDVSRAMHVRRYSHSIFSSEDSQNSHGMVTSADTDAILAATQQHGLFAYGNSGSMPSR